MAEKKRSRTEADVTVACKDCGRDFTFTAQEQAFYEKKGFAAKVRCSDCVKAKRSRYGQEGETNREPAVPVAKATSQTRCFNCGKKGHTSAECQKPQGSTACFICGKEGHGARDCPEAPARTPETQRCFACGRTGHVSSNCPTPKILADGCYICGKQGHQSRFCPEAGGRPANLDVEKVEALVAQRKELRRCSDYDGADKIRAELKAMGVTVQDAEGSWFAGSKPAKKTLPKVAAVCFAFQTGECQREDCRFAHAIQSS